jgi:hypothetical protein
MSVQAARFTGHEKRGQPIVDLRVHAAEIARFHSHVVCGPTASDWNIWTGAIGGDGSSLLPHLRGGEVVLSSAPLRAGARVRCGGCWGARLHDCDNPVCVKIAAAADPCQHFISGPQGDNMERMARMRRGGGRYAVRRFDSRGVQRERSEALREAVRRG